LTKHGHLCIICFVFIIEEYQSIILIG
jgi:hypothetical protein